MASPPRTTALVAAAAAMLLAVPTPARTGALRIGTYYFPGWNGVRPATWNAIKPYSERRPELGWYSGDDRWTMATQVRWMGDNGIDYVAFDWYWEGGEVRNGQALEAFRSLSQRRVDYAVMWANDHPDIDLPEWRKIVGTWIDHYFRDGNYLKVDGKPVVFVLTLFGLVESAKNTRTDPATYVASAKAMARKAGLPGLYFVAGVDDLSTTLVSFEAVKDGFDAATAYNMHRGPMNPGRPGWNLLTQGYPALDNAYRQNWKAALASPLPIVLPITSGWDSRPWGGSSDPLHDHSVATPAQFKAHLIAARAAMTMPGKQHSDLGVICCWNEFGEGSYIEPTAKGGSAILRQIKSVFGRRTGRREN